MYLPTIHCPQVLILTPWLPSMLPCKRWTERRNKDDIHLPELTEKEEQGHVKDIMPGKKNVVEVQRDIKVDINKEVLPPHTELQNTPANIKKTLLKSQNKGIRRRS